MQPRQLLSGATAFKGWARMALPLQEVRLFKVGKPFLGEARSIAVYPVPAGSWGWEMIGALGALLGLVRCRQLAACHLPLLVPLCAMLLPDTLIARSHVGLPLC